MLGIEWNTLMSKVKKRILYIDMYIYKTMFYLYLLMTGADSSVDYLLPLSLLSFKTHFQLRCYLSERIWKIKKNNNSRFWSVWSADWWEIWITGRPAPFKALWREQFSHFYVSASKTYL